jgi:hypothetical protein
MCTYQKFDVKKLVSCFEKLNYKSAKITVGKVDSNLESVGTKDLQKVHTGN